MSRIRGKNTRPELLVRKFLFSKGFRYRLHDKRLPGKPDIFLPKYSTVIFINGCFWHGHQDCKYFKVPATNTEWWLNKIGRNQQNDQTSNAMLLEKELRVITIWECQLKKNLVEETLQNLIATLHSA